MLLSLVNAAARDCVKRNQILNQLKKEKPITTLLKAGVFEVKTIEDAFRLAGAFSYHAIRLEDVNLAISELIVNAVEHGNLGIGYDEKNHLLQNGTFNDEINRRLALPDNVNKVVKVIFERIGNKITILIEDQGNGFDWKKYMNFEPMRLTDLNGRGIASANIMRLGIEYIGSGNKVKCQFDTLTGA
jgi:anti-sigma regulatory factor (Ser/Thr protein kinase)